MKDKKIIILIILILISIIALIGSSYALLTKSFKSEKLSMQVGTLKIDFTDGNIITMTNAAPMTDEDGMNSTPYTFTITNSGNIDAYYTVSNEEELSNTLDTSYLKMRLTGSDGYDSGIKILKELGTETYRIVDETSLATGKSVTYKLYLWLSSEAENDIQDKVYKSKIVVSSTSNKESMEKRCQVFGGNYVDGECRKYYVMKNNMVNMENVTFGNEDDGNKINHTYDTETKSWIINYTGGNKWYGIYLNTTVETVKHLYYGYYDVNCSEILGTVRFVSYNENTAYWHTGASMLKKFSYSYYFSLIDYLDGITGYYSYLQYNIFPETTSLSPTYTLSNYMVIDLTLMFGEGNEPSKEWCDKNLTNYIEYNETGVKTLASDINYTGNTSYYDIIDISK